MAFLGIVSPFFAIGLAISMEKRTDRYTLKDVFGLLLLGLEAVFSAIPSPLPLHIHTHTHTHTHARTHTHTASLIAKNRLCIDS